MKRIHSQRVLLVCTLLLMAVAAFADQLSPQEALNRYKANVGKRKAAAISASSLAYTSTVAVGGADYNTYYVYNTAGDGFVILSADDLLPAVLARVEKGNFDWAKTPDVVKVWLSYYDAEIQHAIASGKAVYSSVSSATGRAAISPLVRTRWGQEAPYNRRAPMMDDGTHAVTGCVATALSQILYYYRNPAKPTGEGSWTCADGVVTSGTYDFSTYQPNYDGIARNYGYVEDEDGNLEFYPYTKAQSEAIAELMYAAGASVAMQYGYSSGAYMADLPKALISNWGFDGSARYEARNNYSDDDWENLLYGELALKRPVLYGGQGAFGGHAFICDGYDGEGLYHFNWGWDGQCDGYYTIMGNDALNPYGNYGYTGSGFYIYQDMISGVQLNRDYIPELNITMVDSEYSIRQADTIVSQVDPGAEVELAFGPNGLKNNTGKYITIYRGAMLKSVSGNATFTVESDAIEMDSAGVCGNYSFSTAGVPRGTYKVYPAVCWQEARGAEWVKVRMPEGTEIQELTIGIPYQEPDYDLNHDGDVNSYDVSVLKNYLLGRSNLVPASFKASQADFNQDGRVDVVDLQLLQNEI